MGVGQIGKQCSWWLRDHTQSFFLAMSPGAFLRKEVTWCWPVAKELDSPALQHCPKTLSPDNCVCCLPLRRWPYRKRLWCQPDARILGSDHMFHGTLVNLYVAFKWVRHTAPSPLLSSEPVINYSTVKIALLALTLSQHFKWYFFAENF